MCLGLLTPSLCPLTLSKRVLRVSLQEGAMSNQIALEALQSLTHDQIARRLILLNRVNATAMQSAERFSDEAAKIAALARAIRRSGVSLIDRVAMLETIEHLATLAESEAALDRNCIEYFCDSSPERWDDIEHELSSTSDPVTRH
jgi:N-acyl-D-aspartate/D-glutamate deacylase